MDGVQKETVQDKSKVVESTVQTQPDSQQIRAPVPTFQDLIQHQHNSGYWKPSAEAIFSQFFEGKQVIDANVQAELAKTIA